MFRVRFSKSFDLIVAAASLNALEEALEYMQDREIEDVSGGEEWGVDMVDPSPRQRPHSVVIDGKFMHPDEVPR